MWVFGVIGIKLWSPQKFSCGPFGSDGCWLGSSAPRLQMPFEDCFHPLLETQGQIRNRLFSRGIPKAPPYVDTNACVKHNFSVRSPLPLVFWHTGEHSHTLTQTPKENATNCICLLWGNSLQKSKKKMLRTIGLENPLTPYSSTIPPCHLIFSVQHANQTWPCPAIALWDQELCLSLCHEWLKSNTFKLAQVLPWLWTPCNTH